MENRITFTVLAILLVSLIFATSAPAKLEPWSQIEARTKFLRTKHYIEVIRVHFGRVRECARKTWKSGFGAVPCSRRPSKGL